MAEEERPNGRNGAEWRRITHPNRHKIGGKVGKVGSISLLGHRWRQQEVEDSS